MRFLLWAAFATAGALGATPDLFSGFETGWGAPWTEHALAAKANVFRVEENDGDRFLRVDSMDSASALWRKLDRAADEGTQLSWRWRVTMSLDHIDDERRRGNDDYAARVAVMFDGEAFDRNTRALMYVWSGRETVGVSIRALTRVTSGRSSFEAGTRARASGCRNGATCARITSVSLGSRRGE